MKIKKANEEDLLNCLNIFKEGLNSGISSFQEPSITIDEFHKKLDLEKCLVLEIKKQIKGYSFFTKVSNRCVYKGVGQKLLNALIHLSEELGYWSLHAMIFSHNTRSIKLHEKCNFKVLGLREKIGKMTYGPYVNQWIDNTYMERRSPKFQD